jgi:outer membrane protein assembly factor BamB
MNDRLTLERLLMGYAADETRGLATEQVTEDILIATAGLRPEPRWLALLKEPPMHTQTRVAAGLPGRRLLVLAAAAAAVIALLGTAALVGSNLLRSTPGVVDNDWPGFRGDGSHTGVAVRGPQGNPLVTWKFHARGPVSQNVGIVGDTLYVPTEAGLVQAVDLGTGAERWAANLDSGPASGVIVTDGLVLVRSANGAAYAFDARTGAQVWRSSSPVSGDANGSIGGGSLYVGTSAGDLVALDIKTGKERWRDRLTGDKGGVGNTAFANDTVFAGTEQAGFFAVDAGSGAVRWRVDVGDDETGTPVVDGGVAYIGAGADATVGHLRAIDATSGRALWTINEAIGSPTIKDGVGYAQAPALAFEVALDLKTGDELWRTTFPGGGTTRAAVITPGALFVPVDGERRIYALDPATGLELWQFDLDGGNQCCIAVAKGSIFVGTEYGTVYRIDGDGASLTPSPIARPS